MFRFQHSYRTGLANVEPKGIGEEPLLRNPPEGRNPKRPGRRKKARNLVPGFFAERPQT